ncbi:putative oligopeptide transporter, partial [Phakopsora pachyrhizi]
FRSISVGIMIGTILTFTNTYFGLQTGWISMMSLQSALIGFGLFKVLSTYELLEPLSVSENILLQTTSTAVASMPLTAGFVGLIPALAQLNLRQDNSPPIVPSFLKLIGWSFSIAFFGVFLAIPLRRQVIVKEKLVFPSGSATAQMLTILHRKERLSNQRQASSSEQWKLLFISFVTSLSFLLCSLMLPVLWAIPLFDVFGPLAHRWSWWFTPSFAYVGQGIIMGFHTAYSMIFGMLIGWAFLCPMTVKFGWSSAEESKSWIIWPALSIMIVESVISLGSVALSIFLTGKDEVDDGIDLSDERSDKKVGKDSLANKVSIIGFLSSGVVCVGLIGVLFDRMSWWATLVALLLASIFSLLGVRALGQTDLNPVQSIGKISQLIFGILQPNNSISNLISGGLSEAGAMQSGEIMQDFKTGSIHGVSPSDMFYGQMIGSFFSIFISTGIYELYRNTYELPSTKFPIPTATVWLNLSRLLNGGGKLPEGSESTMVLFGLIFLVIGVLKTVESTKGLIGEEGRARLWWSRYLPSGIAFSVGFINTPSFSITRFIGGCIAYFYHHTKTDRSNQAINEEEEGEGSVDGDEEEQDLRRRMRLIIIASGFVIGEGIGSLIGLILKGFILKGSSGALSCWGCFSHGGGYCGGDC